MTLAIPTWSFPLLLTAAIWLWGVLAPGAPSRGDYDFSPAIFRLFRLVVCVAATLVFWLAFFVAKAGGFA